MSVCKTRDSSTNVVKSSNGLGGNGEAGEGGNCWASGLYLLRLQGTDPEQTGSSTCYELRGQCSNW